MALVVFLRGVNVGGHRTFRPSLLAHELSAYGLINIGAAGTFVASKPVSRSRLRAEFCRRLPFAAEVMICTAQELIAAAACSPFNGAPPAAGLTRFVSVLAKRPAAPPPIPLQIPEDGRWLLKILSLSGRFVFGIYRREMKAISCLGRIDKLFAAPATTRNWNTIGTILKLLERC